MLPMSTARVWGKRIRERRDLLNMTQAALAAEVGVHQTSVSKWEKGEAMPSHRQIPRIAQALHADASVLFEYPRTAA